jgi:hypothetical protein
MKLLKVLYFSFICLAVSVSAIAQTDQNDAADTTNIIRPDTIRMPADTAIRSTEINRQAESSSSDNDLYTNNPSEDSRMKSRAEKEERKMEKQQNKQAKAEEKEQRKESRQARKLERTQKRADRQERKAAKAELRVSKAERKTEKARQKAEKRAQKLEKARSRVNQTQ